MLCSGSGIDLSSISDSNLFISNALQTPCSGTGWLSSSVTGKEKQETAKGIKNIRPLNSLGGKPLSTKITIAYPLCSIKMPGVGTRSQKITHGEIVLGDSSQKHQMVTLVQFPLLISAGYIKCLSLI